MKQACIALGSNLDDPVRQLRRALQFLAGHPAIRLRAQSSFYRTAPVGYAGQPDFVNAAALLDTALSAPGLLAVLQQAETEAGRVRSFRNAPRTLDLDIIDYNGESSADPHLTLPHPRAHERSFVMLPLAEILPDFVLGKHGKAADLAAALGNEGIALLAG